MLVLETKSDKNPPNNNKLVSCGYFPEDIAEKIINLDKKESEELLEYLSMKGIQ